MNIMIGGTTMNIAINTINKQAHYKMTMRAARAALESRFDYRTRHRADATLLNPTGTDSHRNTSTPVPVSVSVLSCQ